MPSVAHPSLKAKSLRKTKVKNPSFAGITASSQDTSKGEASIILKNLSVKPEFQLTHLEKSEMIGAGLSKKDLQNLKDAIGLNYDQLAKTLSVARATLVNKKGEEKFNPSLCEKILSLADIFSFGFEIFEDEQNFKEWLFRSNVSLGGQLPFDLLSSPDGREEIKNLLGRIEYGVFS